MYNVYIYLKCIDLEIQFSNYTHIYLWLVVFYVQRGHLETAPHLLSLAKDPKLCKYTVPSGN